MPTPKEWTDESQRILERERQGGINSRPAFSEQPKRKPLNHIPNGNDGCTHCDKAWSMHTLEERVLR